MSNETIVVVDGTEYIAMDAALEKMEIAMRAAAVLAYISTLDAVIDTIGKNIPGLDLAAFLRSRLEDDNHVEAYALAVCAETAKKLSDWVMDEDEDG